MSLEQVEACAESQRLCSEAAERQRDELKSLSEELEEESLKIKRDFKKEDDAERCALRRVKRRQALAALRKDVALLARPSEASLSSEEVKKMTLEKAKELKEMQRMMQREGMRVAARELWKKSEVSMEEILETKKLKEESFDEEIYKAQSEALKLSAKALAVSDSAWLKWAICSPKASEKT